MPDAAPNAENTGTWRPVALMPGVSMPGETPEPASPAGTTEPGATFEVRFDAGNGQHANAIRGDLRETLRPFEHDDAPDVREGVRTLMSYPRNVDPALLATSITAVLTKSDAVAANASAVMQLLGLLTTSLSARHTSAVRVMKKKKSDERKRAAMLRALAALQKAEAVDPTTLNEHDRTRLEKLRARVAKLRLQHNN